MALDLDRGVMTKYHPSGLQVSMYLDDPGIYMDQRGERIDDKFAAEAGFDLEKNRRERVKQIKLAEYRAKLEAEFATEEERLATELARNGGHDVRHIGGGQFALFDRSGKKVMTGNREEIELLTGPIKPTAGEEQHVPTGGAA